MPQDQEQRRRLVNIRAVQKILRAENEEEVLQLQREQREMREIKEEMVQMIKNNYVLEGELKVIDNKIGLLIHNRITVQEVIAHSRGLQDGEDEDGSVVISNERRALYGALFYLLQTEPRYLGRLPQLVTLRQTAPFIQAVAFTLFGDQYSAREEFLLLSVFRESMHNAFQAALGQGSLMRGNSAVTKMMREYTRREPGQVYLEQVLTPELEDFVSRDTPSFEIAPLRVCKEMINEEEVATGVKSELRDLAEADMNDDPRLQEVIAPRLLLIEEMCERLLSRVIDSLEQIPYGIRWLAKQMMTMTRERFPEATRQESATMVGGFLFLRFICPAIVTPDADSYKLVQRPLTKVQRRNLVLVAKVLQNLSNFVLFGQKETFLIPLNPFIERSMEPLMDFFERVTQVPDPDEYLEVDLQWVDVGTSKTPTISISANELFLIHSLIENGINTVADGIDDPVRDIIQQLGPAPEQVSVKQNSELLLVLKPRDTDQSGTGLVDDDERERLESVCDDVKAQLEMLLRRVPIDAIPFTLQHTVVSILHAVYDHAKQTRNTELEARLARLEEAIITLEDAGYMSRTEQTSPLLEGLAHGVLHRSQFKDRIAVDRVKIDRAFGRVRSHSRYLQEQLDSYRIYLENIKNTSGDTGKTKKGKKKKKKRANVTKFGHEKLFKDGVIVESRVPESRRKKTIFEFCQEDESGTVFEVVGSFHGFAVDRVEIMLDDLLQRQSEGDTNIVLEWVTLDVNLLIHLINKLAAKAGAK